MIASTVDQAVCEWCVWLTLLRRGLGRDGRSSWRPVSSSFGSLRSWRTGCALPPGSGGGEGRAQTGWPQQNPKRQGFTFHSQKVSYVYLKTIVSLSLVFGDVVAGSQLDLPIQVWSLWEDNGVSLKCFTSPMSEVCGSPPKVGHVERNAADLRSAMSFSPLQRSSPCSSAGCGLSTRTNISGTGKREASQPEFKVRAL